MLPKLYLINVAGHVVGPFDHLDSLADYVCAHGLITEIGDSHTVLPRTVSWFFGRPWHTVGQTKNFEWIVRNDFMEVIPADGIKQLLDERRNAACKARAAKVRGFRNRPVPYTRCGQRHRYTYIRGIRTSDENRQTRIYNVDRHDILLEDGLELRPVRGKRANLPTAWDDALRHQEKNWKIQRLTQYKTR